MKKILLLTILLNISLLYSQDYRYTTDLFTNVIKVENVVYGNAPFINTVTNYNESSTTDGDLIMDIYYPDGDTHTQRPAIVFAHAGGFLNGNRNHEDMVAFCQNLAKKGYVTATIDYRKGMHLADQNVPLHGIRAVYRAIQDGRTAIRFLRANAATYGIDPNKVYMGGSSAGAFIALHAAYVNDPAEKPTETSSVSYWSGSTHYTGPDLGSFDIGNNLGFNGKPDAIISLWGALLTTDFITPTDTTPALIVHGSGDSVVPFDSGYPFGYPLLPVVYGSNPINDKFDSLGFTNKETYFVTSEPHEFYGTSNGDWPTTPNAYWDIIVGKSVNFLWNQHKPTVNFSTTANGLSVDFSDTSIGALSWYWDFGDGNTSTEQNPTHTYVTDGNYDVKLYIENDIKSWNEKITTINVSTLSVSEANTVDFKIYPNPTNDIINISSQTPLEEINIYSLLGNKVLTSSNTEKINISSLSSGVYLLKVEGDDKIGIKRVIKK